MNSSLDMAGVLLTMQVWCLGCLTSLIMGVLPRIDQGSPEVVTVMSVLCSPTHMGASYELVNK